MTRRNVRHDGGRFATISRCHVIHNMRHAAVGSALCTFIAYAAAFVRAESPPQAMETVHRTRQWFTGTWIGRVVLALAAYRIYRRCTSSDGAGVDENAASVR